MNADGERRRFPRQRVLQTTARLPLKVAAEVLDISESGALLRCGCTLVVGERGQLHAAVAGEPLRIGVSVGRVRPDETTPSSETEDAAATRVSVSFTTIDASGAQLLGQLLSTNLRPAE